MHTLRENRARVPRGKEEKEKTTRETESVTDDIRIVLFPSPVAVSQTARVNTVDYSLKANEIHTRNRFSSRRNRIPAES